MERWWVRVWAMLTINALSMVCVTVLGAARVVDGSTVFIADMVLTGIAWLHTVAFTLYGCTVGAGTTVHLPVQRGSSKGA